jgi:hypothetical protein
MSALVMALAAGMVMASGPERNLSETEQRLDVGGVWEGTWRQGPLLMEKIRMEAGVVHVDLWKFPMEFSDEGRGWVRVKGQKGEDFLGIYRWESEQLIICCRWSHGRPTIFDSENHQSIIILKRVKPSR